MNTKIQLDVDVEIRTADHEGHMLNANTTFYSDGGVSRAQVWCNDCKRYLRDSEARARAYPRTEEE